MTESKSVLFLDKVFLKRWEGPVLRGVEVFNVSLIREMLDRGLQGQRGSRAVMVRTYSCRRSIETVESGDSS